MASNDPLGVDLDVTSDLDPHFRLTYGQRNLGNALLRRLNARAGCLASIGDDPNYGYDLAGAVLSEGDGSTTAAIIAEVDEQLNQDERVQRVTANILLEVE